MRSFRPTSPGAMLAFLLLALAGGCLSGRDGIDDRSLQTPSADNLAVDETLPWTEIVFGPQHLGLWGPDVEFRWTDRLADFHRWALTSVGEYRDDHGGQPPANLGELIAWVDTLQFHVLPGGGYDPNDPVWTETEEQMVLLPGLPASAPGDPYLFAVRGRSHAGEEDLVVVRNTRAFEVRTTLDGPRIVLSSNVAGVWRTGDPPEVRGIFAGDGLHFQWSATPGPSGAPVTGFSFAVDDTSSWLPFSDQTEWPTGGALWFPDTGPHSFFVRAIDAAGFIEVLEAGLQVYAGPWACPPENRTILVVLDTDPGSLIAEGIWPTDYPTVERALVDDWLAGYEYQVFETMGVTAPDAAVMDCASTIVWLHSSSVFDGDPSVLQDFHTGTSNVLRSWNASGGNLLLCGIQPTQAMRYFQPVDGSPPILQQYPIVFEQTLNDTTLLPHWAAVQLGVARVNESFGNTFAPQYAPFRMSVATSAVVSGPNPYPDLPFDPLTWPDGPNQGGFGYHDRDIVPLSGAEVAYTFNDTGLPAGVRRLTAPGVFGNCVFLGFHPYFVERPAFRALVQALMSDFGEVPGR